MKKAIALVLALVMIMALAACSNGSSAPETTAAPAASDTPAATDAPAASNEAEDQLFGYTCMDLTNPFHIAMRDELKALAAADGIELIEFDGASSQSKQNDAIDDMIAQGITVLFLNPVDQDGATPALEACERAGVKVITVDSNVTATDLTATYISSDNFIAGEQCGKQIVADFPDGCNIAIIENPLADSVVQRVAGLESALEGTNCVIVDRKSIASGPEVLPAVEDILTANADLQVFWGLNDDVSLMILGSVESAGRQNDIKVMSVDGSPSGKTSVANGGLYATAAQSPVGIADKAYECAKEVLAGNSVEKTYSLPTTLVTAENVQENDPANWG